MANSYRANSDRAESGRADSDRANSIGLIQIWLTPIGLTPIYYVYYINFSIFVFYNIINLNQIKTIFLVSKIHIDQAIF